MILRVGYEHMLFLVAMNMGRDLAHFSLSFAIGSWWYYPDTLDRKFWKNQFFVRRSYNRRGTTHKKLICWCLQRALVFCVLSSGSEKVWDSSERYSINSISATLPLALIIPKSSIILNFNQLPLLKKRYRKIKLHFRTSVMWSLQSSGSNFGQ